jgi:hypothetical protein
VLADLGLEPPTRKDSMPPLTPRRPPPCQIRGLRKRFGENEVLKGIDLR